MSIIEFLADLGQQGVHLWVEDERLRYRAPQPLNDSIRSEIVRQRDEILRFLRHSQQQPTSEALQIVPVPRDTPLPLSFAQERLWFLEQWQPSSVTYHIPLLIRLRGRLDRAVLRASIAAIVQRHESLRTTFSMDVTRGQPVQTIHADLPIDLSEHDLRRIAPAQREAEALRVAAAEAQRPLDLGSGPLTRMALIRLDTAEHLLLVVMHHIITDGWSMAILTQEFGALYQAALSGTPPALPALPIQYADFAVWQRERLQGRLLEQQIAYWQQQLHAAPTLIELPTDRLRPPIQTFRGASQEFALSPALTAALRALSQRADATLFMTLLTGYMSLLARYTGQADLVVGSPIANRTHHAIKGVIGFFVNMLVLRADLRDNPTMLDALARVRQTCLQAYAHQDTPFEQLVELLQPPRSMSHHPLVQAVFVLQNMPDAVIELPELLLTPVGIDNQTAKFDLTLAMREEQDRLHGSIEYNVDLFEDSTISLLIQRFQTLLQALVDDPAQRVAELPLLTPAERATLIQRWDRGYRPFPAETCLHTLFEAHSARTPAAVAVADEQGQLSYAELNARANQLAHYLRSIGVGGQAETLVGFYLDRSVQMVVAVLAILKAGGAYVPLDPGYPRERIALILDDAQVAVVLTERSLADGLPAQAAPRILLDADWPMIAAAPTDNLRLPGTPDQLAYVIYTSGSTGRPKGTLLTHRHVVRLFAATQAWFQFDQQDVWSLFHSIAFDFSVWELWGALLYGGRLVVVSHGTSRSPEAFAALLRTERVTVLNQTPSAFRQLIPADAALATTLPPSALRLVVFGGEALDPASLRPWFARYDDRRPQLVNMYGITETTVHVTYRPIRQHESAADARSLIGPPIPDLHLYLRDPRGEPTPAGLPGELYVGGAGVARGYLNRPALTAERFVPDPFSGTPGARLYRSGDLGRETYDGDIEYLGRIDQQVKLRGFRIELGEIVAALQQHPALSEVAVIAQDAAGGPRLVAYVVTQTPPSTNELRSFLKQRLPEYMIPAAFVPLAALPLTPNGKLDRQALPAPERARTRMDVPFAAPTTPAERRLAAIWAETLGLAEVGVHDNFFALGGDSIRSVQVLTLARQHGLAFAIQDLFQHQTIAELLEHVQPAAAVALEPPPVAAFALVEDDDRARLADDIEDAYPLTTLQSGMLFHSAAEPETGVYHDVVSIQLRGRLDLRLLRAAIDQLAAEHAILRTSFELVQYHQALQLVHRSVTIPLAISDLRGLSEQDIAAAIDAWFTQERRQPFQWQQPPLLRFQLHRRSAETFQLSVGFHHAILDGWSLASLFTELLQRYVRLLVDPHAPVLPPPALTFREYVAQERQALASEQHRTFWRTLLQERSTLRVPRLGRAAADDATADEPIRQPVPLPAEVSNGLHQLAQRAQVPIKSVLLAAHLRVLALIGGSSDIVSGMVTHGRPQVAGSERVLGLFLNTVPFRLQLGGGSWADLVRRTFAAEREMQPFIHYPMAAIQQLVGGEPLFEIIFNFTHFHVYRQIASISEIEVISSTAFERTNFVLGADFNLDLETSRIDLRLDGDPRVVDADQLRRTAAYYERVLAAMAADPDQDYHTFSALSPSEHEQLINGWNQPPTPSAMPTACIHQLFEVQARRSPTRIAVREAEQQLTYAALDQQAERLARRLRRSGVGPETLVALLLERSIAAVVAIIAIWKAGGAYVPIDPQTPPERLGFILSDTRSALVLTTTQLAAQVPAQVPHICLDTAQDESASAAEPPLPDVQLDQLAYVIYTSGSTGQPKGVMVSHRAVANLAGALHDLIAPIGTEPLRVGFNASLVFDASIQPLLQLCSGHTLVIISPSVNQNVEELLRLFEARSLDWFNCTPTQLRMVYDALRQRPTALPPIMSFGGEAIDAELWHWLARLPDVRAFNMYGPTEATVECATAPITAAQPAPVIGRPLDRLQLYILDAHMQPVPVGVAGELYIGGAGVARGYLNRPGLTAERFVPDPFSRPAGTQPGARLYRSGDLARYLPDGNIDYIGRIDGQIKLRGYRIELGEIEAVLRQQPAVQDAAVVLREDTPGDPRLVAYVTAPPDAQHGDAPLDAQLHTALAQRLPAYARPSAVVWLDTLPLLTSGKVDRRSLPQPEHQRPTARPLTLPRSPLEQAVAQVWSATLGITPIGIDDNFFALGGHSLSALRLMAQIERQLGVSLPLSTLLQGGTIAELTAAIQQRQSVAPFQALVPIQTAGSRPPFFCIHPAGGDVLCYRELAVRLGTTQPFYALQAAGIDGRQPPDATIEALAARYLAAIQTQQPEGPYYLGGWSLGGVVAFELARRLQEQGQAVAALVLIDSELAGRTDPSADELELLAAFAAQLGLNLDQLAFLRADLEALPSEARVGYAWAQLQRLSILPADLSADDLANRFRVFAAHALALEHYQAQRLSGALTLIQADQRNSDPIAAATAWSRQVDALTVHSVPGDHLSMLREPYVATLADVLRACLAQAVALGSEQRSAG